MASRDTCSECDAELGVGRFCVNCGRPVEQAAAPLFADEVDQSPQQPAYAAPATPRGHRARGSAAAWVPWLAGLTVLLLVGVVGLWLLLDGGQEPTATATEPTTPARTAGRASPEPARSAAASPTPSTTDAAAAEPVELVDLATVSAPDPAPPSQDNSGNPTRYVADHLLDGVPETCWRTPGDAAGETISFGFEEPVTLREVGLVNGYAKVGQDRQGPLDWYHGNRRVRIVEWVFDDGTTLTQDLGDTTAMQTVPVEVETTTVTLRLVAVSAPGAGRASRDYTAISGVSLVGVTG